jgi:hypothetical protein
MRKAARSGVTDPAAGKGIHGRELAPEHQRLAERDHHDRYAHSEARGSGQHPGHGDDPFELGVGDVPGELPAEIASRLEVDRVDETVAEPYPLQSCLLCTAGHRGKVLRYRKRPSRDDPR